MHFRAKRFEGADSLGWKFPNQLQASHAKCTRGAFTTNKEPHQEGQQWANNLRLCCPLLSAKWLPNYCWPPSSVVSLIVSLHYQLLQNLIKTDLYGSWPLGTPVPDSPELQSQRHSVLAAAAEHTAWKIECRYVKKDLIFYSSLLLYQFTIYL